jgi:hypothetical protein
VGNQADIVGNIQILKCFYKFPVHSILGDIVFPVDGYSLQERKTSSEMDGCRGTRYAYSGDQKLEEYSTRQEQMAPKSMGGQNLKRAVVP